MLLASAKFIREQKATAVAFQLKTASAVNVTGNLFRVYKIGKTKMPPKGSGRRGSGWCGPPKGSVKRDYDGAPTSGLSSGGVTGGFTNTAVNSAGMEEDWPKPNHMVTRRVVDIRRLRSHLRWMSPVMTGLGD